MKDPVRRRSRTRRIAFRAAAVLCAVGASLLLTEVLFRLLGLGGLPDPTNVDPEMTFHRRDAELGYALRPGARGSFQGVDVRINALGCRGPELQGDGPLVIALGDSITFGAGVAEEHTFVSQLGTGLRAQGLPARVLGCGVSGYNLEQAMAGFDRDLAELEPTVVIVNLFVDDLSAPYVMEDRSFRSWLRRHSTAFRTLEQNRLWPGSGGRELPLWATDHARYAASIQAQFAGWLQRHERTGIRFVVVTHPMLSWPQQNPAGPLAQLAELVTERGLPLIQMRPIYEAAVGSDLLSLSIEPDSNDPHPTGEGHRLIAGALLRTLQDHHLVGGLKAP